MSRSLLLVEPDLDVLGALASRLRALGFVVFLADRRETALERAQGAALDAVLISAQLADWTQLVTDLRSDRSLGGLPVFFLTDEQTDPPTEQVEVLPRNDPEGIARRLYALPSRPPPVPALRDDFRGDLQQVSMVDLLQLLSMNRRTGSLTITTAAGAGVVSLSDGQVVDAVYRRLEGEKALYRLLGEQEGSFAFTSGSLPPPARIELPTEILLMDGLRQLDEARRLRTELALEDHALVGTQPARSDQSDPVRRILLALTVPRTVEEILDEVALPDHVILQRLGELIAAGAVRRVPKGAARVALADPEELAVLGALASRLRAPGYSGPARILLAGDPVRLANLGHSLLRVLDAVAPAEGTRAHCVPRLLVTLRLGEATEVDVAALPIEDKYSPLWELAVPGCLAVVLVGSASSPVLEQLCAVRGIQLLDSVALVGSLDESDPAQAAALIRSTLDALAAA